MENKKLANIKKASGVTAKVVKVLEWIVGVSGIICIVVLLACAIFKTRINEAVAPYSPVNVNVSELTTKINIGFFSFDVDFQKYYDAKDYAGITAIGCAIGAFFCAVATVFFEFLRNIFTTLKESDTPFNEVMLRKIKISGIVLAVAAFLASGVGACAIVALVVWCIYCVFDYGCSLQKESDETL